MYIPHATSNEQFVYIVLMLSERHGHIARHVFVIINLLCDAALSRSHMYLYRPIQVHGCKDFSKVHVASSHSAWETVALFQGKKPEVIWIVLREMRSSD